MLQAQDQMLSYPATVAEVVEQAQEAASLEAAFAAPRPNLFTTIEWIHRTDV
jgi:hypothetical protein